MRVGIDVRKLGDGGIGEYIRETLIALRRLRHDLEIVAFGAADGRPLLPLDDVEWVTSAPARIRSPRTAPCPRRRVDAGLVSFMPPNSSFPSPLPGPPA